MHPPYSPDLAPFAYYRFLSVANDLVVEKFGSREAFEKRLPQRFVHFVLHSCSESIKMCINSLRYVN